ncbi:MAG: cell wall hydrolase [Erythrobacter sp.]
MKALRNLLAGKSDFVDPYDVPLFDRDRGNDATDTAPSTSPARPLRKRLAMLLAAIAVPAMAAPGEFGALPGDAPTEAEVVGARLVAQLAANPAMPFEKPGESFPGSAFFFLDEPPEKALIALPTTDAYGVGIAEAGRELGQMIDAGPAARPFFGAGGIGQLRAQECLAQAIWYEAASESEAGQRAVAQVVLNRVAHPSWPGSVCGVVYQGSARTTGCQFTFTCDGSLARRAGGASWTRAQRIAEEALSGSVYAPIGHATHYHTLWVNPYWAASLDHVGTIGAHRFYRNRGAGGERGAFTGRYAGVEPGVSGRIAPLPVASRDALAAPVIAAQPVGASPPPPMTGRPRAPEPVLADPAYSGVGQVRSDYASAGQWKSDAARAALAREERALASESASESPAPQR